MCDTFLVDHRLHCCAKADFCVPVPEHMTSAAAATIGLVFATAQLAVERARVHAGDSVLVHSAAGGVGLAAVELLNRLGCVVYATCSSQAKRDVLIARGVAGERTFLGG